MTRGAKGTIWLDEQGEAAEMPAFPVHTVDTLGAGDIFHGAFTLAIAEGQSLPKAMRFASAAAALKCTRYGGALCRPQRAEVEALLRQTGLSQPDVAIMALDLEEFSIYEGVLSLLDGRKLF